VGGEGGAPRVRRGRGVVEGLAPGDSVGVGLLDSEGVEVMEGLAPVEREGVGV